MASKSDPARSIEAVARVEVVAPQRVGALAVDALRARGIAAHTTDVATSTDDVFAWASTAAVTAAVAVELAPKCVRAAETGRPICMLVPAVRGTGRVAIERAAALSHLRAHGAAITHDIDAWLEAIVMLARFGLPTGPRTAVVAPEGSWLHAQATALVAEAEGIGARSPLAEPDDPHDVMFYDPGLSEPAPSRATAHLLAIPVMPRGELATTDTPALYGARAALGAAIMLGCAAQRIAVGLGPAPRTATAELGIDREKLERQLGRLVGSRLNDHETKALLRKYQIGTTNQVVATTPSAAVDGARRVGFPVEIKPYGTDLSEPQGCPVEKNITSAALVRQAYTAVLAKVDVDDAVIVRETPPPGREVSVSLLQLPSLGWTVVLDAPGARLAAAPAPLRLIDAEALAAHVIASRAGDPEPDRAGLANLLRRASHLVVDVDAIATLELPRVIVGGRAPVRTLVVDAFATLR